MKDEGKFSSEISDCQSLGPSLDSAFASSDLPATFDYDDGTLLSLDESVSLGFFVDQDQQNGYGPNDLNMGVGYDHFLAQDEVVGADIGLGNDEISFSDQGSFDDNIFAQAWN